ncbi:UDP-glucose dehydrogenase [uncultured Candidatus Thioglobus sp.]|nr:UDP-glucose dehydrogenase [uncultured Candidatus Thioglobus sp.]
MIGCGYVGLVAASCFAELGQNVICIDKDQTKIDLLKKGIAPISEPYLIELIEKNTKKNRLQFSSSFTPHIASSDLIFIAVGTFDPDQKERTDLTAIHTVIAEIAPHLTNHQVVINKSTAPIGTSRTLHNMIKKIAPNIQCSIASNPEFLRQGQAVADFMHPDRVVIGVESEHAQKKLELLYQPLESKGVPLLITDLESAEIIKYAANAFLATKISFINELSMLCEALNVDIRTVSSGIGLDRRIGKDFLNPGPGYGGSCLPKDIQTLIETAEQHNVSSHILKSVMTVNAAQQTRMIEKINLAFAGNLSDKKIAILGLTFKSGTDDMRHSPALVILPALIAGGAQLSAYDPQGMYAAKQILPKEMLYREDVYDAIAETDAIVLMTEWKIFTEINLAQAKKSMRGNIFIDLRNLYQKDKMQALGFDYYCI